MKAITRTSRIGDLVTEQPGRARIFEQLDIDYCCGGQRTLEVACQEKGLDPETAVQMLRAMEQVPAAQENADWSRLSLTDLIEHIVETHHTYLRRELPRLERLVDRVAGHHGDQHPWLRELQSVFQELAVSLTDHMEAEEVMVFPMIRALADGQEADSEEPLHQMEDEHAEAGEALGKLRELSGNYTPPQGACNSFRAMLQGLADLERDMHQHVHKENNILFPRARDLTVRAAR